MTVSTGLVLPEGLLEGRGAWGSCLTCAPWGRDTNPHLPGEKGQRGRHPTTVRFGDKHLQGWTRAKGWLNPSLSLNVPFCQWSRRILRGYLQRHGLDVPRGTETCTHRPLGALSSCCSQRHSPALSPHQLQQGKCFETFAEGSLPPAPPGLGHFSRQAH